jgi:hypothetical protein
MRALVALAIPLLLLGCDYHRRLGTDLKPQPTSPLPGAGTGKGTTPPLTWTATEGADQYEVQVDNSCTIAVPCDFPSPEIDVFVTDPSYVPVTPLTVPSTGPRRQTYCWRVRGCHQGTCGEWSTPRCFVVGADKTLNRDLNGDGYSDVVIAAPRYSDNGTDDGRVGVYLGGTDLPEKPVLVHKGVPYLHLGESVATVGDVNGDGYGDYVITTMGDYGNLNGNGAPGAAKVFFGAPSLRMQPDVTFAQATQWHYVAGATGCGDLNGDGYDDLAFLVAKLADYNSGMPAEGPWLEVHFGGPDLAVAAPLVLGGSDAGSVPLQEVAAGDVNGDGYPDLLVTSLSLSDQKSTAVIFYGGPAMDAVPDVVIAGPVPVSGSNLVVSGVGDVNGDGFADVAVAVHSWPSSSGGQPGMVHVFFGGTVPHVAADLTLTEDFSGEGFGMAVLPAGDINNDGYADFAVLSQGTTYVVTNSDGHGSTARPYPGKASLFMGAENPSTTPVASVSAPVDHAWVLAGSMVDLDGDGASDLLMAEWTEAGSTMTELTQVAIYRASDGYGSAARVLHGFKAGDDFGLQISQ